MKKWFVAIIIAVIILLIYFFINITYLNKEEANIDINAPNSLIVYDEEGRVLADLSKTRNTLLNNELEYNEKGNVVAKKVVRINDLNGNDLSTISEDSVLVIEKNEYPFINIESLKGVLKKNIVVLLKYENLEEDVQFFMNNGIKGNNYNLERDDMQKYKYDGYINLEIGEMDKLLLGSYMLKSETDENLLKYVNMSIKMDY